MKIAILDDYQDAVRHLHCFQILRDHEVKVFNNRAVGLGQLAIRLAPFDALVLIRERTTLSRALLSKLPKLKFIAQTGRLAGNIDLEAAKELGITVVDGKGDPTAPAELAWALIMASSRKITNYTSLLQDHVWQTASLYPQANGIGRVLKGRTLGIWGYGRIGKLVAAYGKAFGMQVQIWGSEQSRAAAVADGLQACASREVFFESSDIISLHLRLSDRSHGMIGFDDLSRMKSDALLVNVSRAELIAEGALVQALDAGRPGFAALDVFETEPLPRDYTLLNRENVLLTPHIGFVERDTYEMYFAEAFTQLIDFARKASANNA
ncbi:D-2-hydroxyacid dehydrogenase family protein [Undibacterium cyanobacteriorum]|uniref:D-2-hydroxyacid dehydrogenase family protein n=1 Tax=Undibacterium cyanobacteriorum TaxID=3073561 RepID=A0ABY9RIG3_9BURK|nr:D-2-hydroxyacid dehydrogenase family protein [Undibacterium sp. 20NA77.5]WMW81008.1 D-2-hydroxyacid dehydrogenase family protein [Undibacterium sp. 20NA77.5]